MANTRLVDYRSAVPARHGLLPSPQTWDQLLERQRLGSGKLGSLPGPSGTTGKGRRRQPPLAAIVRDLAGWSSPKPGPHC